MTSKPQQPQLALDDSAAASTNSVKTTKSASLGWLPPLAVSAVVGVGLWGAWVTKEVLNGADVPPIAKVQLQSMVGEYVQMQARSTTPPDQVTAETKAFMTEIQNNLVQRGKRGQIVLVAEAVVSDNIPDITSELRKEVFSKVKMPQPAQMGQNDVMGAMRQAMAQPGGPGAVANGTAN